jgi:hypothetical protein
MSDDEIPDPLGALDLLLRAVVDVAKATRAYYIELIDNGFTEEQATELTIAFQTTILRAGSS